MTSWPNQRRSETEIVKSVLKWLQCTASCPGFDSGLWTSVLCCCPLPNSTLCPLSNKLFILYLHLTHTYRGTAKVGDVLLVKSPGTAAGRLIWHHVFPKMILLNVFMSVLKVDTIFWVQPFLMQKSTFDWSMFLFFYTFWIHFTNVHVVISGQESDGLHTQELQSTRPNGC